MPEDSRNDSPSSCRVNHVSAIARSGQAGCESEADQTGHAGIT